MVVNAKKISDVVLIYDQYYDKKPKPALLLLERVALCCGVCLCAMMFLLAEYRMPVSRVTVAGLSLFFSAGFSLLFVFVKKRFAIPAVVGCCAVIGFFNRGVIWERLTYFMDGLWLLMDGRFIPGKILVDHDLDMLTPDSLMYCDGTAFGFGLIIFLFSMITAACMTPKPQVFPSLIIWILLWSPVLVSEKFTFSLWMIPTLALYMGAAALTSVYWQGIALGRPFGGSYREAAARSERSFFNSLARVSPLKQVEMRTAYFSKYFSSAMYAAALFAALGIVAGGVFSSSSGIDYTKLYDFVKDLGEHSPFTNPFEKDPSSDWFAEPDDGGSVSNVGSLSITTPGRGNQEILRVKNMGDSVVYLRGDVGIDFTGEDWTSPVDSEPQAWRTSGLAEYYRPVEVQVLFTLQKLLSSTVDYDVSSADVTIDYLVDSTVTFLPAYTSDFGYFDNEMFKIYGDFVARVNKGYDKMDSVYCTALVPAYTNMDDSLTAEGLKSLRRAAFYAQGNGGVSDILDSGGYFTGHNNVFTTYKSYVQNTYMSVPEEYWGMIHQYVREMGFYNKSAEITKGETGIVRDYLIAEMVADYLRTNYTYSLNTDNSGANPLNSFLNETKSGHCAMYASAMALILREMGIPARYCTGFVVLPNNGRPTVLRSKNLHAWVEVYLDELGWVTFDPTSSSQTGGNPGEVSRPESSTVSSTPESSSSPESSGESSEDSEASSEPDESDSSVGLSSGEVPPPEDQPKVNILPFVLCFLAVIAVLALVFLLFRLYNKLEDRALSAIRKIQASGNAELLLDMILAVMRMSGVTQKAGELPRRFYARAEKEFHLPVKEYGRLLQAVGFGNDALDRDDCARLAVLLERLFNAAEKRLHPLGRIKLRMMILSRKSPCKE